MRTRGLGRVYQPTYRDRRSGELRTSPTWWIAYSFRGTKYRESSRSPKRQDAVRLLKQRLGEIGRGRFLGPQVERTSFEELATIIIDDYTVNGRRSKGRMLTSLSALRKRMGPMLARDITFDRLTSYIAGRLTRELRERQFVMILPSSSVPFGLLKKPGNRSAHPSRL